MQKTAESSLDITQKVLLNTQELQAILSCGYSSAVKLGVAARARVSVGKRVLWNKDKVQAYLNIISD